MTKSKLNHLILYILIIVTSLIFFGCNKKQPPEIEGSVMDFKIEILEDNSIIEDISIKLDTKNYIDYETLNLDKVQILSYLETDTIKYLKSFKRCAQENPDLSSEIKDEYVFHKPIDYESMNVNNSNSIKFEMRYKNSDIRKVWYYFIQSFDNETNKGVVLDYKDKEIFGDNETNEPEILTEKGTWFNKSYYLADSIYKFVFIPYPTFKKNFVDVYDDVKYTQTTISRHDNLKTNAFRETFFKGGVVERVWLIDINASNQIEYFIMEANRSSWYILALSITFFIVIMSFIYYFIKKINNKRKHISK